MAISHVNAYSSKLNSVRLNLRGCRALESGMQNLLYTLEIHYWTIQHKYNAHYSMGCLIDKIKTWICR